MKENVALLAFNRGIVSRLALARTDIKRVSLSAEQQSNWMPRALGSMMLRPGFQYIGTSRSNLTARYIPFIYATDDLGLIEITDGTMRVLVDETVISRVSVSSAVANGTFAADLTNWTDADESGATSAWATGYMSLVGSGFNAAIRRQEVTVSSGDRGVEHALRIVIERGPVSLRVGSTSGAEDYIAQSDLKTGVHSLAFTPTGNFHIELSNRRQAASLVGSVAVEGPGDMEIATPWSEGDLSLLRYDQSNDVIFVACKGHQQRRIERRGARSWSVVLYSPEDGPYRVENVSATRLTPSGLNGDITLTSSAPLFRPGHIGALFRLTSVGQKVEASLTDESQFTDDIRVTGVGAARAITIQITGTWSATVTLQRSVSEPGAWVDVGTYTGNVSTSYNDALDNQITYYRIGIKADDFTSGTAAVSLTFSGGSRAGVVRITAVTDETTASAAVVSALGGTAATENWSEGAWSDYRGWPSAVALYEGRLWWAGKGFFWGSISDAYEGFDDEFEGDAGPVSRSIASGPSDSISWLLPLQRLLAGTGGSEVSVRSSSFDEPLTPTNFSLKDASTQGTASIGAVKVDSRGVFIQRSGLRVYELDYEVNKLDYASIDLTALCPEIGGENGFAHLAVQRQPDTRVHCVRADGTVAVLVYEREENLICWVLVETDGEIEDVVVLPGTVEDAVYYLVKRTINGATVRYLEKWAREDQCRGRPEGRLADSHLMYSGVETTTITDLGHLEGQTVVVWGWNTINPFTVTMPDGSEITVGRDMGTYMVSGGKITGLPASVTNACIGLAYGARYKSAKLAYAAGLGTALTQRKRVGPIGLILADTHAQGLRHGPSFDVLDDMPRVEDGATLSEHAIWEAYDKDMFEFPGEWNTDSRVCLEAAAPRPATVLACILSVQTNDKA